MQSPQANPSLHVIDIGRLVVYESYMIHILWCNAHYNFLKDKHVWEGVYDPTCFVETNTSENSLCQLWWRRQSSSVGGMPPGRGTGACPYVQKNSYAYSRVIDGGISQEIHGKLCLLLVLYGTQTALGTEGFAKCVQCCFCVGAWDVDKSSGFVTFSKWSGCLAWGTIFPWGLDYLH